MHGRSYVRPRYRNLLNFLMASSFIIPVISLFLVLPFYGMLLGGWLALSFAIGAAWGISKSIKDAFTVGMTALIVSGIGLAVGTLAVLGGLALAFTAIPAMIVTAPTIIGPVFIGVVALGVAAVAAMAIKKSLGWIVNSLSYLLESNPVAAASSSRRDGKDDDRGFDPNNHPSAPTLSPQSTHQSVLNSLHSQGGYQSSFQHPQPQQPPRVDFTNTGSSNPYQPLLQPHTSYSSPSSSLNTEYDDQREGETHTREYPRFQ